MRVPVAAPDSSRRFDVERYDQWFERPWGRYASSVERRALGQFVPTGAQRMLDVGCGTGRLTLGTASGAVIGADYDFDMLKLAQRRLGGPVVQADADHLPFADGTFDVTTAVTLCEFTESAEVTIAELVRVTRPGGQLVLGALNPRSPWGLANRSQFDFPPWSGAKWLSESTLRQIGSHYGDVETVTVLYAPRAAPGLRWWGPLAERVGRLVAPHHGAFIIARIQRSRS